jgi:hypothetical protein
MNEIEMRKNELLMEIEKSALDMAEFAKNVVKKLRDEEIMNPNYHGMDYLHDACHTLRGRLPKGGFVMDPMSKKWKNE